MTLACSRTPRPPRHDFGLLRTGAAAHNRRGMRHAAIRSRDVLWNRRVRRSGGLDSRGAPCGPGLAVDSGRDPRRRAGAQRGAPHRRLPAVADGRIAGDARGAHRRRRRRQPRRHPRDRGRAAGRVPEPRAHRQPRPAAVRGPQPDRRDLRPARASRAGALRRARRLSARLRAAGRREPRRPRGGGAGRADGRRRRRPLPARRRLGRRHAARLRRRAAPRRPALGLGRSRPPRRLPARLVPPGRRLRPRASATTRTPSSTTA